MSRDQHTVGVADAGYPRRLLRLSDPPDPLHLWGRLPAGARLVAIVGTRGAHRESTDLAGQLAADLSRAGLVVVSGGAVGVDAAAHRGALEAGAPTVAVLGSGLERLYPARNIDLFHGIARHGAVITAFPPQTPPRRHNFPQRNRIVAALASAVVVVEAPVRSGALNTARHARQLGVPLLAAPRGQGALTLLRGEAGLVRGAEDVLRALEGREPLGLLQAPPEPDQRQVLELLRDAPAGRTLDQLAAELGWHPSRIAAALLRLEVAGWARSGAGGLFSLAG